MNKRGGVVVVAIVLLAVIGWVGYSRYGKKTTSASSTKTGSAAAGGKGAAAGQGGVNVDVTSMPMWLGQFGVAKKRIAGKVMHGDKPVAGATVRLGADLAGFALQPIAEVKSDASGAFDFGPQIAGAFDVSAESEQFTAAAKRIDLADPKAKSDKIVLQLGDCRSRLFGSVLDASGGAIAKARVTTTGLAGGESDAAGKYSVCVAEGDSSARIVADGYGSLDVRLHLFGELQYDFVLVPEAVLVGQVITQDKQPVAGARVVAIPDPGEGPHHLAPGWTATDADGRFRIDGISPGHYRLGAAAEGLVSASPVDAIAATGTAPQDTIIVVSTVARVSGRVVMGDKPVAGARVFVPKPGTIASAFTQDDGTFVMDRVPMGSVPIAVAPYEVKAPKTIEVKSAKVDDITIDVSAMGSIVGKVTRHGKPVAGADVISPALRGPPVKSDENGDYALLGLPPGQIDFFAWDLASRSFTPNRKEKLGPGETKHVDLELDRAGTATGVVVDDGGKPVPGVYVRMISEDGTFDQGESMTDAAGKWMCHTMAGGDYIANVYPSPMAGQAFAPATGDRFPAIKVPADGSVAGVTLAIKFEQLSIKGSVTDDAGSPVADVHIEAIGRGFGGMDLPSIMSRADGTFEIKKLARGTYALHAHASDGSEADAQNIASGSEGVAIRLIRPGAIEGTLDGFTKTPDVSMLTLTANLQIGTNAIVDGNRFYARGLRPGRYAVEAKADLESAGETVEVKSGETAKVVLKNRGTGHVEGHVAEFGTKAPLSGWQCDANLSVNGQMGQGPRDPTLTGFSDEKGHFAMTAPLGKVRVFCFSPGGSHSVAGTDVDVTSQAPAVAQVFAVPNKFGATPGDPGFRIRPIVLPLVVNDVVPGGPAATQGLKAGDIIVTIDGATLQGVLPMGASFLLGNHKPGTTVTIGVERGGAPLTLKITLGATPT
ncbi:MAG TPA: carboxypeptidase regulatory-like domain-containing protein [Kofleriaceae bacterium]|nr:carboxypeptidase regulatory-like domain-containing protein [Kofleriaceae bacterium]